MKKIVSLIFIILIMALNTSCSKNRDEFGETYQTIRVSFNQNTEHPQYLAMKKFGEEFEKRTNGRYKIKIYPNGVLGSQNNTVEFIRTGALQMAIVPSSSAEVYETDFAIVGAPYLYEGIDHMSRAVQAGVYDDLFKMTHPYNFEVETIYTAGERNVYAKKPIETVEDLEGQIIRVNDSPTYIEMTKLMGGNGAVMSQSEVYTALQQGVVDAAENSELVYRDFKNYEVAPYYAYTKHIVHPDVVIASLEFLNSLNEDDRKIYDELIKESSKYEFELFSQKIEEAKKEIQGSGVTFSYPDVEALRQKVLPLTEKIANQSDTTKKVYESINELRER
ncbi:TRAP transporter substrate-binding protein [Peptoniphilus equinus]|uniref:TRAP transporter substrate-binding protein n=1 Tax=Peptoniphilus equinus TaxID=3016343 RepID=A0ABY7QUG1_9FIRM|nr:TRAP transporter substrate-binding protein [Peptoniphilus equinus]WBW50422.1 TRAP transporter substrate-binding protein [Peptoniphilus equinus]